MAIASNRELGELCGVDGINLQRQVGGEGPLDAEVVLVGEAPGEAEVAHRRPFIGLAGRQLDDLLRGVGIERRRCRVENVVERRPPANKIEAVPGPELAAWCADLRARLGRLEQAKLVVPLGGTALNAVMGWTPRGSTVMKYRGTVLASQGRTVIPTLHPAALLRSPNYMRRALVDWGRIGQAAAGNVPQAPERQLLVAGHDISWDDTRKVLYDHIAKTLPLSVDIETLPEQRKITCVGFATSATQAITISTYFPDYANGLVRGDINEALSIIRQCCDSRAPKIGQNFVGYDTPWLREVGRCEVGGRIFDTRWMHHAMYPSDGGDAYVGRSGYVGEDHGLAYLASIYTLEPFWKDEAKSGDRLTQLRYNGKDCAVTFEVWTKLCAELVARGQWEYYVEAYESLYEVLGDPQHLGRGVLMDMAARKAKLAGLASTTARIMGDLDDASGAVPVRLSELQSLLAGPYKGKRSPEATAARAEAKALEQRSIFGEKGGISFTKVQRFLEDTCHVRLPKKRGKDSKNTDEVALRQVYLRLPKDSPGAKAIPLILSYRNVTKQGTFLAEKNYDPDHYVRCTYTQLPETGRLSSQSNHFGTGMNLQNVMREVRDVFVADPGCVLLECDLSAAEDRVVNMLTRDPKLIEVARIPPWERKPHRVNAASMFGKSEADVTKEDYDIAKRTAHGTHYDMKSTRMSEQWLKESEGKLVRTPLECAGYQRLYIERVKPQLPRWHQDIRMEIMQHRCLSNPFGRILDLTWERLDDDTFKRGYAFKPQSTVGMLMNQFGVIPLWHWLRGEGRYTGARMAIQLHDAVYFCVRPEFVYDVAVKTQQLLERPVVYYGQPMVIPVAFKVGTRWGVGHEWDKLPSANVVREVAEAALVEHGK